MKVDLQSQGQVGSTHDPGDAASKHKLSQWFKANPACQSLIQPISTMMLIADRGKQIAMKPTEETVNPLLEIDEKAHKGCVMCEKGRKTLCE